MAKLQKSRRPLGRSPVVAVRVPPPLREEIIARSKKAERTMSAEVEDLLRAAIDARKRFPDSNVAWAVEAMTFAFLLGGSNYARDEGLNQPWQTDLAARREAWLRACVSSLPFVSTVPQEQKLALDILTGRILTQIINRPRPDKGGTS